MHRLGNHQCVQNEMRIQPVGVHIYTANISTYHIYTADISTYAITVLMLQES